MPRFPLFAALLTLLVAPVLAQTDAPPPVPDVKPPVMVPLDDSLEPQVTITQREGNTVEETRVNGKLYKITVTPDGGVPYTLIDQRGDGTFVSVDAPGTPALSLPMWVIGTF
jgi:hypothetical protein